MASAELSQRVEKILNPRHQPNEDISPRDIAFLLGIAREADELDGGGRYVKLSHLIGKRLPNDLAANANCAANRLDDRSVVGSFLPHHKAIRLYPRNDGAELIIEITTEGRRLIEESI